MMLAKNWLWYADLGLWYLANGVQSRVQIEARGQLHCQRVFRGSRFFSLVIYYISKIFNEQKLSWSFLFPTPTFQNKKIYVKKVENWIYKMDLGFL